MDKQENDGELVFEDRTMPSQKDANEEAVWVKKLTEQREDTTKGVLCSDYENELVVAMLGPSFVLSEEGTKWERVLCMRSSHLSWGSRAAPKIQL